MDKTLYEISGDQGHHLARLLIDDKEFNDILRDQVEFHKSFFKDGRKPGFIPMIEVYLNTNDKRKREVIVVAIADFTSETKYQIMERIGETIFKRGVKPIAIYFSSEAWLSYGQKDLKSFRKKVGTPSQDPNHQEVLMTTGMTIDGRTNMAVAQLKRIGDSKILGDIQYNDYKGGKPNTTSDLMETFFKGFLKAKFESEKGGNKDVN